MKFSDNIPPLGDVLGVIVLAAVGLLVIWFGLAW